MLDINKEAPPSPTEPISMTELEEPNYHQEIEEVSPEDMAKFLSTQMEFDDDTSSMTNTKIEPVSESNHSDSFSSIENHSANYFQDLGYSSNVTTLQLRRSRRSVALKRSFPLSLEQSPKLLESQFRQPTKNVIQKKKKGSKPTRTSPTYNTNNTRYRCPECGICRHSKSDLTRHLLFHRGIKPYKCSFCDTAFTMKSDVVKHERIHTGEKPWHCCWEGCTYSASVSASVLNHVRSVHLKLKPFNKKLQLKYNIEDARQERQWVKKVE